jgi:hypothetical protein
MKSIAILFSCALTLFASCGSTEPEGPQLAPATEIVEVRFQGDAFVTVASRRIPRERFVVELRHRVRSLPASEVAGMRVVFAFAENASDAASADADWVLGQLQIMGISQVAYR